MDQICVGVPAGEVKSLSSFTLRATTVYFFIFALLKLSVFVFAQVSLRTV